jgi:large conductance mechanosensitive channel
MGMAASPPMPNDRDRPGMARRRRGAPPPPPWVVRGCCDGLSFGRFDHRIGGHTMKKMLAEFKEFISKGDIVMIAVGLIMALYFAKIVDALLVGVINPIIAAIFGKSNFQQIGFDIGDARISIGLVIDAAISFVVVAFVLYLIVKAYNKLKSGGDDAAPTQVELLTEIRDQLRANAD